MQPAKQLAGNREVTKQGTGNREATKAQAGAGNREGTGTGSGPRNTNWVFIFLLCSCLIASTVQLWSVPACGVVTACVQLFLLFTLPPQTKTTAFS